MKASDRAWLAAGAVFVALAAVLLLRDPRGPSPGDALDGAAKPGDAPGLAAGSAPGEKPGAAPAAAEPEVPRGPFRIRGRVGDAAGKVPEGTVVRVMGHVDRKSRYFGRAVPGPDGAFAFEVEPAPRADPTITVVAWAPGLAKTEQVFSAKPGVEETADLRFSGERVLRGVVVDETDRPVPGVPLLVMPAPSWSENAMQEAPDPWNEDEPGPASYAVVSRVVTGPDGSFAAGVVEDRDHVVWSTDDRWWIEPLVRYTTMKPGPTPTKVRAREGWRIDLEVVSADATGDPVSGWPPVRANLAFQVPLRREEHALTALPGPRFLLRGPRPGPADGTIPVTLRVESRLHELETLRLDVAPGARLRRERIALRRLPPSALGTLVVESDLRDASGAPVPVALEVRHGPQALSWSDPVSLRPRPDGTHEVVVRAGPCRVQARPATWNPWISWSGDVDVRAGGETRVRVAWPPNGIARLRVPAAHGEGQGMLMVNRKGEEGAPSMGGKARARNGEIVLVGLPAGTLEIRWFVFTGVTPSATVHVPAGGEVVADLGL